MDVHLPNICYTRFSNPSLKLIDLDSILGTMLFMLSSLEFSSDSAIEEWLTFMKDPDFLCRLDIPSNTRTFLEAAQDSTSSIYPQLL